MLELALPHEWRFAMTATISAVLLAMSATVADAQGVRLASGDPSTNSLCAVVERTAALKNLPLNFFTRLIWRESRFNPLALSPAGARGLAQFMPKTATGRGLLDPFEPTSALHESAAYLGELRQTFGNLGLAAAAYNAGPGRLGRWIGGQETLPRETIDYVQIVTGHSVFEWNATPPTPTIAPEPDFSCVHFTGVLGGLPLARSHDPALDGQAGVPAVPPKPWAVILVGGFKQSTVLSEYGIVRATYSAILARYKTSVVRRHLGGEAMMKYVVQIEEDDRAACDKICKSLETAGGACLVLRNTAR